MGPGKSANSPTGRGGAARSGIPLALTHHCVTAGKLYQHPGLPVAQLRGLAAIFGHAVK